MIKRILKKIVNQFYIVEKVYKVDLKDKYTIDNAYDYLVMDISQINLMFEEHKTEVDYSDVLKQRIEDHNFRTFAIKKGNSFCGFFNIAFDTCYDNITGYYFNKDNKDNIHLFHDYTFKKWRGKGVHKASIIYRMQYGIKNNKKSATTAIVKNNIASEKSYLSCGFKHVESLIALKFFKIKIKLIKRAI